MTISKESIIGELVANDYRIAAVFKSHKIDFCCQGNRTIEQTCEAKKIDCNSLLAEINNINTKVEKGTTDFKTWPIDLLADYIQKKHHRYVEEQTAEIKPYLAKICRVHGEKNPNLFKIKELFDASAGELAQHMKKEELILFPFIRKMASVKNEKLSPPHFGTVENPIKMMMDEHLTEGGRFEEIAKLSNNYTPPADACNTYRVSFALLKEFEEDLHLHIHLENNILFPSAIELEKSLSF